MSLICTSCPRRCNVDRSKYKGYCRAPDNVMLAKVSKHYWEEPCISGTKGSGTIFFCGCNLRCVYCQNSQVSNAIIGKEITVTRLAEIFKELENSGVHNINLVTPSHYVDKIIEALNIYRPQIPIVYNTSGYDSVENIKKLEGYIDIYLTDLKYVDANLSEKYSGAKNYFDVASVAIKEMIKQRPNNAFDDNGIMQKGVIIRHLVLPGHTNDSIKVLEWIKDNAPNCVVSVMSQYTPYYKAKDIEPINRKLKPLEYKRVIAKFQSLGLANGYMQELSSSTTDYIPDFDLSGVTKCITK